MENDDVFIYDGHSGLGAYLGLDVFPPVLKRPLELPRDKSQIFFFDGCSTFSYYNRDFFNLKASPEDPAGTKNLDILTTAIGAAFDIGARDDVALIVGLVDAKRPSWQKILRSIYEVKN
jgi:hypothetical protein